MFFYVFLTDQYCMDVHQAYFVLSVFFFLYNLFSHVNYAMLSCFN